VKLFITHGADFHASEKACAVSRMERSKSNPRSSTQDLIDFLATMLVMLRSMYPGREINFSHRSPRRGGRLPSSKSQILISKFELSQSAASGAHLASVHSGAENSFIHRLCLADACWLGGSDEASEGRWTWTDGSTWNFASWNRPHEPNNCVSFLPRDSFNYHWW